MYSWVVKQTAFAMYSSNSAPPFHTTFHQSTIATEVLLRIAPFLLPSSHNTTLSLGGKGAHPHLAQYLVSPPTTTSSLPNQGIDSHGLLAKDTSITLPQNSRW
jgi:hypothetical protein